VRPRRATPSLLRRRVGIVCALSLGAALGGCGGASSSAPSTTQGTATSSTTTTVPPTTTTTTDPGTLPQTPVQPPSDPAALAGRLAPLWAAITTGDPAAGRPVFFPASAYLQLKTGILPAPAADYTGRLVAFYDLDTAAYHQAVSPTGAAAGGGGPALASVVADPTMAAWIPPGACENRFGYWHLPGVRLVYRSGGTERSVGVASLISWRGEWYVVHLGPNPRPADVGTVDAPAVGPGTPGPAGGC